MNVRGERIIIFGDSLSHPGSDSSPTIQDITQSSSRQSSAPGDLLGSFLLEQGAAAVRVNARVGRSAWNFWQREAAAELITADHAFKPTKVIVMLGTNDADSGVAADKDRAAFQEIADAYREMGAEVWAVGPFVSAIDGQRVEQVVQTMKSVFGMRFIDGRPLSQLAAHARDGVHYTAVGARTLALGLTDAILSKISPTSVWNTIGLGVLGIGVVFAGSMVWSRYHRKTLGFLSDSFTTASEGATLGDVVDIVNGKRHRGSTNELVRKGFIEVPCSSKLDESGLARCWKKPIDIKGVELTGGGDDLRVGQYFDHLGQTFTITKITGRKNKVVYIARPSRDSFGKITMIDARSFDARDFDRQHLRPIEKPKSLEGAELEAPRKKKTSPERKALEAELERLYRQGGYAGNTPEDSARIDAKIAEVRAKLNDPGLAGPYNPTDPAELWGTDDLRAEVTRRLKNWRPALKDVRRFHELMDELSDRTGKSFDELRAELGPKDLAGRAPQTGPNAAIDSRAHHAWGTIESMHQEFPETFAKEYKQFKAIVDGDDYRWDQNEEIVKRFEKTARSMRQRAAKMRKAKPLAGASDEDEERNRVIAYAIKDSAARAPRFGDRKVMISDVYEKLIEDGRDDGMTLDEFKHELVRLHKAGALNLTRADLVAALDSKKVAKSETDARGATFHFVTLDGLRGSDDDEEPRPRESNDEWWNRLQAKHAERKRPMREALAKHDALILQSGDRRVLVLKTPEVADVADGEFRVTEFDADGPIGHTTRKTVSELADELTDTWRPSTITPATDDDIMGITGTERFSKGAANVIAVQKHNTGKLEGVGADALPRNPDGTVTLYHHTSAAKAAKIRREKVLRSAGEPNIYLTTHKPTDTGYGDTVIEVDVDPGLLTIDDEFPDGRMDFRTDGKTLRPKQLRGLEGVKRKQDAPGVIIHEIDDAERRARAAGAADRELTFIGAGMEGITFCDDAGKAYKVGRHGSLRDEAEWLKLASSIASVAPHVPKHVRYDGENNVIVRECLVPVDRRRPKKLWELHDRLARTVAPYGHGRPEFKEDSYVMTRRGPVLVDAGFANKHGDKLVKETLDVLNDRAPAKDPLAYKDLAFAIRFERGRTIPEPVANKLLRRLQEREPSVEL